MNRFKKHISYFLLLVSFAFIIPQELLHELTSHKDTLDETCCSGNEIAVSPEHHHCSSLQSFVEPYHSADHAVDFVEISKTASAYFLNVYSIPLEIADAFSIRGPPAAVVSC